MRQLFQHCLNSFEKRSTIAEFNRCQMLAGTVKKLNFKVIMLKAYNVD